MVTIIAYEASCLHKMLCGSYKFSSNSISEHPFFLQVVFHGVSPGTTWSKQKDVEISDTAQTNVYYYACKIFTDGPQFKPENYSKSQSGRFARTQQYDVTLFFSWYKSCSVHCTAAYLNMFRCRTI